MTQLDNCRYIFLLGLSLLGSRMKNPSSIEKAVIIDLSGNQEKIEFSEWYTLYQNGKNKNLFHEEYVKTIFRTFIRDSYELIANYQDVKDLRKHNKKYNKRMPEILDFTRIVRNCLSHSFKFVFNNYDMEILPIKWREITLTKRLEGKNIDLKLFSFTDGLYLCQDLQLWFSKIEK